jgi:hypothetical protein
MRRFNALFQWLDLDTISVVKEWRRIGQSQAVGQEVHATETVAVALADDDQAGLVTDAAGRGDVIGSACLWTSFQVPFSKRKRLVTRKANVTI